MKSGSFQNSIALVSAVLDRPMADMSRFPTSGSDSSTARRRPSVRNPSDSKAADRLLSPRRTSYLPCEGGGHCSRQPPRPSSPRPEPPKKTNSLFNKLKSIGGAIQQNEPWPDDINRRALVQDNKGKVRDVVFGSERMLTGRGRRSVQHGGRKRQQQQQSPKKYGGGVSPRKSSSERDHTHSHHGSSKPVRGASPVRQSKKRASSVSESEHEAVRKEDLDAMKKTKGEQTDFLIGHHRRRAQHPLTKELERCCTPMTVSTMSPASSSSLSSPCSPHIATDQQLTESTLREYQHLANIGFTETWVPIPGSKQLSYEIRRNPGFSALPLYRGSHLLCDPPQGTFNQKKYLGGRDIVTNHTTAKTHILHGDTGIMGCDSDDEKNHKERRHQGPTMSLQSIQLSLMTGNEERHPISPSRSPKRHGIKPKDNIDLVSGYVTPYTQEEQRAMRFAELYPQGRRRRHWSRSAAISQLQRERVGLFGASLLPEDTINYPIAMQSPLEDNQHRFLGCRRKLSEASVARKTFEDWITAVRQQTNTSGDSESSPGSSSRASSPARSLSPSASAAIPVCYPPRKNSVLSFDSGTSPHSAGSNSSQGGSPLQKASSGGGAGGGGGGSSTGGGYKPPPAMMLVPAPRTNSK